MRELVGFYADIVGWIALSTALVAWTIEAAAKGHSITAAIVSPLTVFIVVIAAVTIAEKLGYFPKG